jgi:hypothetical protein
MYMTEQMDTSFHTVENLRTFSPIPVLVSLPRIVTKADTWRRRRRFALAMVATVLSLAVIGSTSYVVIQKKAELIGMLTQSQ